MRKHLVTVYTLLIVFPLLLGTGINQLSQSPLADAEWVRLGGPLGGLGYDIRMRPDNPDIMYVTDANAGVHMSTDGGRTWHSINEGIDVSWGQSGDGVPSFSLTIDPNNYDIIWAGMQELSAVFRSEDGGTTWERRSNGIEEPWGFSVRGISIEPGNSDVVYIAGEVSSWQWAGVGQSGAMFDKTQGVVYKSTDGGQTWRKIWQGDNLARYVLIDPRNVDVLHVSTGIFDRESANTVVEENIAGGVGILKSVDGGETWEVSAEESGLTGLYVGSLSFHPENPDILIAGAGHDYWSHAWDQGGKEYTDAGVFISRDAGASWEKVLDAPMISSIEVCEGNPNIIYAGGEGIFTRSEDGGQTWEQLGEKGWGPAGIVAGFPIDFQCDPRDPTRLFVNNYGGGNFITEDGGQTWADTSQGYTGAMMRSIAVDPNQPNKVYAGGRSGLFLSVDGGLSWRGLAYAPANFTEINSLAISPADSDIILSAPWDIGGRLARSEDSGRSWTLTQFFEGLEEQQIIEIVFAPSDPSRVYLAAGQANCLHTQSCEVPGEGLFVSNDAGETWERLPPGPLDGANVIDIAIHPENADEFLAATPNTVFKTVDGGVTWEQLPFEREMILTLDMAPSNPDLLFAGTWEGFFRSQDGGATWQPSMAGMDFETAIEDVVVDPSDANIAYAADSFSGVYFSNDGGMTWKQHINGMEYRAVQALAITDDGHTLYAATEGGGVFRLSTLTQDELSAMAPPEPTSTPVPTVTPVSPEPEPVEPPVEETVEPQSQARDLCPASFAPLAVLPLVLVLTRRRKQT